MVRRPESSARRIVRDSTNSYSIDVSKFLLPARALDDCGLSLRKGSVTSLINPPATAGGTDRRALDDCGLSLRKGSVTSLINPPATAGGTDRRALDDCGIQMCAGQVDGC